MEEQTQNQPQEQPKTVDLRSVIAAENGGAVQQRSLDNLSAAPRMSTYRCTISDLYPEGSIGYEDFSSRQGVYVVAGSMEDAKQEMKRLYPMYENFTATLF